MLHDISESDGSGWAKLFKEGGLRFHGGHQLRNDIDDFATEAFKSRRFGVIRVGMLAGAVFLNLCWQKIETRIQPDKGRRSQ